MKRFGPLAFVLFFIVVLSFIVSSCGDGDGGGVTTQKHQWKQRLLGAGKDLYDIFVLDASHVWAVGAGGTIIFYDGTSWSEPIESNPKTTNDLNAVVAFNADDVWALGHQVRVHFDGSTWSTYTTKEDPNLNHTVKGATVVPPGPKECENTTRYLGWAVTGDSNYYAYGPNNEGEIVWNYLAVGNQPNKLAISANCEGHIWSAGNDAKIHTWTPDDGWQECLFLGGPFSKSMNGISVCQNQEKGYGRDILILAVGEVHLAFHSEDGNQFSKYDTGENDKQLNDVFYLDESHAWAVGNDGIIVFSNNPPLYWEIQTWESELAGGKPNLFGVAALDGDHVWAVGANGTLLEGSPSE
jgi:photosystem II stability/assembly factor-like uncharacterized protein